LFGVSLKYLCCLHDWAYEIGGSEADRLKADEEFRDGIAAEFAKGGWFARRMGPHVAEWRYQAVRKIGMLCFNYRAVPDERFVKLVEAAKSVPLAKEPWHTGREGMKCQGRAKFHAVIRSAEAALAEAEETKGDEDGTCR